jgi:hypothetical protein
MVDHQTVLLAIESAERDTPRCSCGRPTVPVAHEDGTLWLECSSLTEPKSAVRRFLDLSGAHTQVEILPVA